MGRRYVVGKSYDNLISLGEDGAVYRSARPKESLIDSAQTAYLLLLEKYGENYIISPKMLWEEMECSHSTFCDNFKGINDFISISERTVIDRFSEAVDEAEEGLDKKLKNGFKALYTVDPHSRYNAFETININMELRTEFCVIVFGSEYWRILLKPLIPAIDDYLIECDPYWNELTEAEREFAYSLFADAFRRTVGLMIEQHISRRSIFEQSERMRIFVSMYKKQLQNIYWSLFENRQEKKSFIRSLNKS